MVNISTSYFDHQSLCILYSWVLYDSRFISLNDINQLIFVMVKCGVLFEVRTEFLSIIKTSLGFKGLTQLHLYG
jgi:hypothetical protein